MTGENRMSSISRRIGAAVLTATLACTLAATVSAQDVITLNVRDASLSDVLLLIARQGHINIVPDGGLPTTRIAALNLTGLTPRVALTAVEKAYALREISAGGYTRIVSVNGAGASLDGTGKTSRFDVPGGNSSTIVQALQAALPGLVIVAAPGGKSIIASGAADQVDRAGTLIATITNVPNGTDMSLPVLIGISNSTPTELLKNLSASGLTDSPMSVVADDPHNRLVVRGPVDAIARLRAAITTMDTPVAKVTFEVQVLDVQPTANSNIGIQWSGADSTGKITQGATFTAFANRFIPISATLNALVTNGTAAVLARPQVAVANGKTGKVLVGEQYPIAINNGALAGGGNNVQFVPIGVQLALTPTIGTDGTITVDLTTTYSELVGTDPVSQYPIIGQRTVQSVIPVKDGEPIILAGLFQTITSDVVQKVPLLSSIPILGAVFKNRQKSKQHDEIIFALYPHIGVAAAAPEVSDVHN